MARWITSAARVEVNQKAGIGSTVQGAGDSCLAAVSGYRSDHRKVPTLQGPDTDEWIVERDTVAAEVDAEQTIRKNAVAQNDIGISDDMGYPR